MRYLITYASVTPGQMPQLAMEIADDPIEWLASCQEFPETYFLINAQPISEAQAAAYDGRFKGM